MKKAYVLGSLNIDVIIKLDAFPKIGETVLGSDAEYAFGGKGANQAVACQKLGIQTSLIGCVGTDSHGIDMIHNLINQNVDTTHVLTKEGTSGMAVIYLSEGDNQIVVSRGTNKEVTLYDVKDSLLHSKPKDFFVTQFEVPIDVVDASLKYAKNSELITVLNPSPFQQFDPHVLDYVDILIVNEHELEMLDKLIPLSILKKKVQYLVVTKGKNGSVLYYNNQEFSHKGFDVNVVDTTAAGDTFLGAFLSKFVVKDKHNLLAFANAAGALATTKIGAQSAIPSLLEVNELKEKHDD